MLLLPLGFGQTRQNKGQESFGPKSRSRAAEWTGEHETCVGGWLIRHPTKQWQQHARSQVQSALYTLLRSYAVIFLTVTCPAKRTQPPVSQPYRLLTLRTWRQLSRPLPRTAGKEIHLIRCPAKQRGDAFYEPNEQCIWLQVCLSCCRH